MQRKLFAIALLLATMAIGESSLQMGFGLSHLSQRYVLFEEDTLSVSNEVRLFSEGKTEKQLGNHNLGGNCMLSLGSETFWERARAYWRWTRPRNLLITTSIGADSRQPFTEGATTGYFKGSGDIRAKKRWTDANGSAKFSIESKKYNDLSSYYYDYSLAKLKLDFGFPFFGGDELSIGYQFAFRYAPDTIEANYQRNNFYLGWHRFYGGNYLRADFEAERRIYNRGDLTGNYLRTYTNLVPRMAVGEKITLVPELAVETYSYDSSSAVYPNREEYILRAGVEWSFDPYIHGGVAPKYLLSHAAEDVETDNFYETSLELTFDWLRYRKIWLDLIVEPGLRFYTIEPEEKFDYYSNFLFVEVCGYMAWWINPRLRLDGLISYSPEWHDIDDDDITTFYFSMNLKYDILK